MATVGSIATTPASRGNGTAPPVAPSIAFPPSPWRRRSSPRSWRRWMTGRSSRRRPAVRSRPGTPSIRAVRPNWPACGQPSENGGRPSTGTCGPSRRDGCPSRPAGTPRRAGPRGARVGGTRSDPGSGVRHDSHDGNDRPPGRVRRRIEQAAADGAPEQLRQLLDAVVDRILVESRACIQPYFVAPMVRTRVGPRRRTGIEPA
jgi:hypothetical protein